MIAFFISRGGTLPSKHCNPIYTAQEAHCNTIDHIIRILPFLHGIRCLGYEILTLAAPPLPLHLRAPGEIEIDLRWGQRPPRMRRGSL